MLSNIVRTLFGHICTKNVYLSPKYIHNKLFSYIEKNYSYFCQRVHFPNISFSFLQIECSNGLYEMCIETRFHGFILKKRRRSLNSLCWNLKDKNSKQLNTDSYGTETKCKTGIPFPLWTVFDCRPYSTCIFNYFEA